MHILYILLFSEVTHSASLYFWNCFNPAASCGLKSITGSRLAPSVRHCKPWAGASKHREGLEMSEPQRSVAQTRLPLDRGHKIWQVQTGS